MDILRPTFVASVFVIAGAVKGISGMGLPTTAMSLLGLLLSPTQAASLLVVPSLATNISQCRGGQLRALTARLWPMWVCLVLVIIIGPGPNLGASASSARRLLGLVLMVYGISGLLRLALPQVRTRAAWPAALAGALTGLVTAATAVFVIPMVPFLQALRLEKKAMIQALGLSFTIATIALAIRLHDMSALSIQPVLTGLALAMAFAGMWVGGRVRSKLSQQMFRRVLFATFVVLGGIDIWRNL